MAMQPLLRRYSTQSAIQSACCSIDTIMLLSTEGLPGPVMVKRFGKPAMATRAFRPLLLQRPATSPADVDGEKGARHGVEARGEDDAVERIRLVPGAQPVRGYGLDGRCLQVDQGDIAAVEGGVVVGVDAQALGAQRIVPRQERLGDGGVADDRPDLGVEEIGRGIVGVLADEQVGEGRAEAEAAASPASFIFALALVR